MHPALTAVAGRTPPPTPSCSTSIADWCLRYTPLIACDPPDGLLLDIGGCAHLYGGEDRLVADLAARVTRAGLTHRIAVAGTIGAAHAAARFGKPGMHPEGEERALLASLPLAALRLPAQTVAALARVGLKRIGDIVDLPRAPLAARFGEELLRQLDRALGHEHEPLNPRLPVAPYVAEQRFAEPIAREEDVLAVIGKAGRPAAINAGAARRWRPPPRTHAVSHRRRVAPAQPPAPRGRCAIRPKSAHFSSNGWPLWPMSSTLVSASTWRGCRWSSPNPARPSRSDWQGRKTPPSSTGWSIT